MVENRQAEALAITCIFPIIAALFVAARTVSRYLGQNFGWDDWLMYLALVLTLGQTITIYECEYAAHSHAYYTDVAQTFFIRTQAITQEMSQSQAWMNRFWH